MLPRKRSCVLEISLNHAVYNDLLWDVQTRLVDEWARNREIS